MHVHSTQNGPLPSKVCQNNRQATALSNPEPVYHHLNPKELIQNFILVMISKTPEALLIIFQ